MEHGCQGWRSCQRVDRKSLGLPWCPYQGRWHLWGRGETPEPRGQAVLPQIPLSLILPLLLVPQPCLYSSRRLIGQSRPAGPWCSKGGIGCWEFAMGNRGKRELRLGMPVGSGLVSRNGSGLWPADTPSLPPWGVREGSSPDLAPPDLDSPLLPSDHLSTHPCFTSCVSPLPQLLSSAVESSWPPPPCFLNTKPWP